MSSERFEMVARAFKNYDGRIISERRWSDMRDDRIEIELIIGPGRPSARDRLLVMRLWEFYQRGDVGIISCRALEDPQISIALSMRDSVYAFSNDTLMQQVAKAGMIAPAPLSQTDKERRIGIVDTLLHSGVKLVIDPAASPGVAVLTKAAKCYVGDLSSHEWVDVPREGPSARRCSRCGRVTGQFWSPDDVKHVLDWLVSTVKLCVCLWAQTIDPTVVRFSLLEFD